VYLDQVSGDVPDAYTPQVRYWVESGGVRLRLRVLLGGKRVEERTFTSPARDAAELSKRVVAELIQMLPAQSKQPE
jgi:hypothetical protein